MSASGSLTPDRAALLGRIGAFVQHSRHDPRETTRAAREAFLARFILEVDPDGVLPEPERLRRAEAARRAYFARLALRSAERRAGRRQPHPISTRRSPSPAPRRLKAA